jgi:hypothetical protein
MISDLFKFLIDIGVLSQCWEEDTAMKENSLSGTVLVGNDSARTTKRRPRDRDSFTTVRFEEKKRDIVRANGAFWFIMTRRMV